VTPAFVAVLVPAAVLVVLGSFGAALALVLVPFLVYTALVPVLGRGRIDRLGSRAREASGDLNAHVVDTVQGLAEIVAYRQVKTWGEALAVKAQRFYELRLPFLRDLALQTAFQETATGIGGLVVIATGAWLVHQGRLDPSALPLLTLLALSAFVPLWEVAQVGRQLADTLGAARRLHAIDAEPVPVTDGPGVPSPVARGAVAVELANVRFTYPGRPRPALDGVSLRIADGSTVALVGPSGAGKTTVASLLLRFWDPQSGRVLLNGHDLRQYRLNDVRARVALVAQDTYLFNDTLRRNILIANPQASEEAAKSTVPAISSEAVNTIAAAIRATMAAQERLTCSVGVAPTKFVAKIASTPGEVFMPTHSFYPVLANKRSYLHQQAVDTSTPAGRALFQMLGVFAEFERAMIVERVKAGLRRAAAQGKKLGRPRVAEKLENAVLRELEKGHGIHTVARTVGVGTGTVQRIMKRVAAA